MPRRRPRVAVVCSVALAVLGLGAPTALAAPVDHRAGSSKLEMGFFEQWSIYGRGFTLADADREDEIAHLTDLDYAFGGVLPAGGAASAPSASNPVTCQSLDAWADYQTPYLTDVDGGKGVGASGLAGNFEQLAELKAKYPGLRPIMSLGGYTGSRFFSDAAATAQSRADFVSSCIDLFVKGNLPGLAPGAGRGIFDGFDLDWEYPGNDNGQPGNHFSPADAHNYVLLVQEFRRELDRLSRVSHQRYRLTAELPAGVKNATDVDAAALAAQLDDAVIMDYDFQGPWTRQGPTGFDSNLFSSPQAPDTAQQPRISVDSTVNYYLRRGVPARKIVIGVPYYGHGWTGVAAGSNDGLYQPATGPAPSPDVTAQGTVLPGLDGGDPSGTTDYYELVNQPGYTWHTDLRSGATWLYNPTTQTFWSMGNPTEVLAKALYVDVRGLAGASIWDLSADYRNQLTGALTRGLGR